MALADLRRVARCKEKIEEAYEHRDEAIWQAWRSGESMRDIARFAGLSHQRVQQICAERSKR